jgi:hypothetical protein
MPEKKNIIVCPHLFTSVLQNCPKKVHDFELLRFSKELPKDNGFLTDQNKTKYV